MLTTTTEGTTAMTVILTKCLPVKYHQCEQTLADGTTLVISLPDYLIENDPTIRRLDSIAPQLELRTALVDLDGVTAPLVPAGTYRARLKGAGLI